MFSSYNRFDHNIYRWGISLQRVALLILRKSSRLPVRPEMDSYIIIRSSSHRDAVIVTTLDTFTSLLAGITIFAILGNLAHNLGVDDIRQVVKSGTGLAFISYPDAISKIKFVPQLFSVLFFLMLFVLGIGSVVALVSAVVTILWDQFPRFKYWQVAIFVCAGGFLCGLIYVTPVRNCFLGK